MRQYAGIVIAREYVLAIERNAPFSRIRTSDLQVSIDVDACT